MDPEMDFAGMMSQFATFLIGRKTFDVMKGMGNAGKSSKGITNIVALTHAQAERLSEGENRRFRLQVA